jgi:hypothetical protein
MLHRTIRAFINKAVGIVNHFAALHNKFYASYPRAV